MRNIFSYQHEYVEDLFECNIQTKFRKRKLLDELEKYKPENILEIGCGTESIGSYLDTYTNLTIIEPSIEFIQKAKDKIKNPEKVNFIEGFMEDKIDIIKNNKFDFIIISSLLHEVIRPEFLLKSLLKFNNNGDTIIHINVPNAKSFHRILAFESGIISNIYQQSANNIKLQQNYIFDLPKLEKLIISELGFLKFFEILDKGSYFLKPLAHAQMQRCLDESIFDSKILDGLYNLSSYFPEYGSEIYINFKI